MTNEEYHFGIRSDVIQVGTCPEERTPIYSEIYYIVAEKEDGSRYAHGHTFRKMVWIADSEHEFGGNWSATNALELAQELFSRIENVGKINLEHWNSMTPAYGSEAYIRENVEYDTLIQELANG